MFKHIIPLIGMALSAILLSGCVMTQPSSPSGGTEIHPAEPTIATSRSTAAPTPAPAPAPTVAMPWHAGMFENGIQLYWHTTGSDETVRQVAARSLDYVVKLGANSVGITFPIYTDGATPSKVYAGKETPSPEQLSLVIEAAKARHLRVMVRPLIDEANIMTTNGAWRGTLQPTDVATWFASYRGLLVSYAQAAAHSGADEFVAGTELFSLQQYTDQWQGIISAIANQAHFAGAVSYSVNWDSKQNDKLPFSVIGLDAYPAIQLGDDASISQLTAALAAWIDEQPASIRQRLTIQEVGIPAISGMYPHPWYWSGTGPQNLQLQANWFTAVYQAAKQTGLRGLYYWMLDSNVDPSQANAATDDSGSFIRRPAEAAIKHNFS